MCGPQVSLISEICSGAVEVECVNRSRMRQIPTADAIPHSTTNQINRARSLVVL